MELFSTFEMRPIKNKYGHKMNLCLDSSHFPHILVLHMMAPIPKKKKLKLKQTPTNKNS